MSAESNSRDHATAFHWWVGSIDMSVAEAEIRDLAALRDAVEHEIALQAREVAAHEGISWETVADVPSPSPAAARRRYEC